MTRLLTICLAFWALFDVGQSVSTKLEFDEEKESSGQVSSNTSTEDEDVEVKHTIVVSTKLKNNNRRGLHNTDDNNAAQTFSVGHALNAKKEESDEVPIIKGYKSVESTVIRTPDTRTKPPVFTNHVYVSRNIPYDYNTYPVAGNPSQWKPSSFFNNINWWSDENAGNFNNFNRRNYLSNGNQATFHRKVTDDGIKEFYCRKCRELSNGAENRGCSQERSSWFYENTTPKIKIDGKIAKLN